MERNAAQGRFSASLYAGFVACTSLSRWRSASRFSLSLVTRERKESAVSACGANPLEVAIGLSVSPTVCGPQTCIMAPNISSRNRQRFSMEPSYSSLLFLKAELRKAGCMVIFRIGSTFCPATKRTPGAQGMMCPWSPAMPSGHSNLARAARPMPGTLKALARRPSPARFPTRRRGPYRPQRGP